MASYNPTMQKADFADADADADADAVEVEVEVVTFGRITKRIAKLDGISATLVRFPVGAGVTEDAVKTGGGVSAILCECS